MSPTDSTSLELARSLSSWGEILVWLGVAMEVPEAVSLIISLRKWISLKRYVSHKPPHPEGNWICGLIAVFGLVILVIGLSLEIPGHRMELRITDAENRRLAKELHDAVIQAGEANKLAGKANERAATLENEAELLRSTNLGLAQQLEITKNVANKTATRVDPYLMRLVKVSATAELKLKTTPPPSELQATEHDVAQIRLALEPEPGGYFPIQLVSEKYNKSFEAYNTNIIKYQMQFHTEVGAEIEGIGGMGNTVGVAGEYNRLRLHLTFLSTNTPIEGGSVWFIFNEGYSLVCSIGPQRISPDGFVVSSNFIPLIVWK
jgi:hypothetical protein